MNKEPETSRYGDPMEDRWKATEQRDFESTESEIMDLKLALTGNPSSRAWQQLDRKLKDLQVHRKRQMWFKYGVERYPRADGDTMGQPPRKLIEMIPDL